MKKIILISSLLIMSIACFSQQNNSQEAKKDSITSQDMAKVKYVVSYIVMSYNQEMYKDSIPVSDFIGKPVGGYWWKTVGQYYWDIYTPLPQNVKYLHRKMTAEGLLEKMQMILGGR